MRKQLIAVGILSICLFASACGSNTASSSDEVEELKSEIAELQQELEEAKQGKSAENTTDLANNSSNFAPETQELIEYTAENAEYQGVCGADAKWYYKDNVLVIRGTGEITDNPWQSVEYKVDGKYSERIFKISWVIIDEGITALGDESFELAEDIAKVILPSSLHKIGNECFRACHSLSSINISDSITEIGVDAFERCDLLDASTIEKITAINSSAYIYPQTYQEETVGEDTGM